MTILFVKFYCKVQISIVSEWNYLKVLPLLLYVCTFYVECQIKCLKINFFLNIKGYAKTFYSIRGFKKKFFSSQRSYKKIPRTFVHFYQNYALQKWNISLNFCPFWGIVEIFGLYFYYLYILETVWLRKKIVLVVTVKITPHFHTSSLFILGLRKFFLYI
jgi:hypothetical protein